MTKSCSDQVYIRRHLFKSFLCPDVSYLLTLGDVIGRNRRVQGRCRRHDPLLERAFGTRATYRRRCPKNIGVDVSADAVVVFPQRGYQMKSNVWASGRALGTVRFSSVSKVKRVDEFGKLPVLGPKGSARARSVPKSRTGPGLSR